ncbi:MAG: hypothetical protein IT318_15780 [Anaerolineales bacterium]|nr:hypothetical protein [Anaerolineales bacterium]
MNTLWRRQAALLALAWLLAACTLHLATEVEPGGSGEFRTEVGFNQLDQQGLEGLGMSPEQFCEDLQSDQGMPIASPVTVVERGDEIWCIVTMPFQSLDELRQLYDGMEGVDVNQLALTSSEFTYDVDVEFSEASISELGDVPVEFRWVVAMPGTVRSDNADESDETTLIWYLSPGEAVNARAVSGVGGSDLVTLPGTGGLGRTELILIGLAGLCCCGGLAAALGAGAFFLSRRGRSNPPSA